MFEQNRPIVSHLRITQRYVSLEETHLWSDAHHPNVAEQSLPLVRHEQQPGFGLALRKEVLHRRGVIASPKVRAPGPKLNATDREELTRLIERVEQYIERL